MKRTHSIRNALLLTTAVVLLVLAAAVARPAHAATLGVSLTNCAGTSAGYSFTVNATGFDPLTAPFNVQISGAGPAAPYVDPNYVDDASGSLAGDGGFVRVSTAVSADGSFSFDYTNELATGNGLPATLDVVPVDPYGNPIGAALFSMQITPTTPCTSGSLAGAPGGTPPPPVGPTSKEQCKDYGWKHWTAAPFSFRNQGDCVSYVEHLKKGADGTKTK